MVGSIMHAPGHFWAIVWYGNQVWHYGDGGNRDVYIKEEAPGRPYVTTCDRQGCPNIILYVRKTCQDVGDVMVIDKVTCGGNADKNTEMDLFEEDAETEPKVSSERNAANIENNDTEMEGIEDDNRVKPLPGQL